MAVGLQTPQSAGWLVTLKGVAGARPRPACRRSPATGRHVGERTQRRPPLPPSTACLCSSVRGGGPPHAPVLSSHASISAEPLKSLVFQGKVQRKHLKANWCLPLSLTFLQYIQQMNVSKPPDQTTLQTKLSHSRLPCLTGKANHKICTMESNIRL